MTHSVTGFPGQDTRGYYNAAQYFQKQSVTDMDGHTTTMGVGTDTAGTPGDADANPGDRGQVLWVRDAGYGDPADPNSPSHGKQFTYTYNQYGQKASQTDLNGVVTTYTYGMSGDDLGNLVQVVQDPGGAGHLNRATAMHYDVMGRVLQSTDPSGLTSSFTYNSLGQPLAVATPTRGAVPGETITYVYDTNGRTLSVSDAHRTTTMAYKAGSDRVHSVADSVTGTTGYAYGVTGERVSMTLPGGGSWAYAYVSYRFGSGVTIPKDDPNSVCRTLLSVTDDQGRTMTVNAGAPADNLGNIPNIIGQTRLIVFDQAYATTSGLLASYCATHYFYDRQSYAGGDPNSVNTRGWLREVRTTFYAKNAQGQWVSRVLSQNDYTYDTMGQRLTNAVSTQPLNTDGTPQTNADGSPYLTQRTAAYAYDDLNRLKTVDYGDGETQGYAFDAMGNRLSKSDAAGGTTASTGYAYDSANRLTGVMGAGTATYASDSDGNTLSDGTRANTWDSQNRLVSRDATQSKGTYTPTGSSSSLSAGRTRWYVYDGLGSIVGEVNPSGNLTSTARRG